MDSRTKVCILCKEHGKFWQSPRGHLNGQGCPECGGKLKLTTEHFIGKAQNIHGDKYDYSKSKYESTVQKIIITCRIHGDFYVTPNSHLRGQGCPVCAKELCSKKMSLSQEQAEKHVADFLKGSSVVLNRPFVYDTMRRTKIELRCTEHGTIWTMNFHNTYTDTFSGCSRCRAIYSKEVCQIAALQYKSRAEFGRKSKGEYFAAMRNGWLDEICAHMEVQGNLYSRCIYAYEFPNVCGERFVYVGLTQNMHQRHLAHRRAGSIFKFCQKNNIEIPIPKVLTGFSNKEEAAKKEGDYLSKYIAEGWKPINKVKTGGLGGNYGYKGYTFEQCREAGGKFQKRSEWKKNDYPTYYAASLNKWIDDILPLNEHFGNAKQKYWTKERLRDIANQFKTITELREHYPSAYVRILKEHCLEEVAPHLFKPPKALNLDIIIQEIEKYETLTDFRKACPSMVNWLYHRRIKLRGITKKNDKARPRQSKRIYQYTLDGNYVQSYESAREAAKYGFNFKDISAVCNGKRKQHKGYMFSFIKK